MSGDLDLYAPNDAALSASLTVAGFVRDDRPARLAGGYFHPKFPRYGVEPISGQLFDGRADRSKLIQIIFDSGNGIVTPSVEDMIADRLGQFAASNGVVVTRLRQAQLLFQLADELDIPYLKTRISDEGCEISLLKGWEAGGNENHNDDRSAHQN